MAATVRGLAQYLDERIPRSLSCEWDNDGVMVCGGDGELKKILLTLDMTADALEFAANCGCECVISHHPLIFKPLRSLAGDTVSSRAAIYAITHGITVMSYHTRLDALEDYGVNDTLCGILGVENAVTFGPAGEAIGRIGELREPFAFDDFCVNVKDSLGSGGLVVVDAGREVKKIALIGGDGKDYLMPAIAAGADTFLTGRCGYNLDIDAAGYGINVIEAGHYNTEAPVLKSLQRLISEKFGGIEFVYYNSDKTKIV